MGTYVKKTDRRRYEDRSFSVRAVHREDAALHKLAEVLIRLTLQETGLSLIHISEHTRLLSISYAVFCLQTNKTDIYQSPIAMR